MTDILFTSDYDSKGIVDTQLVASGIGTVLDFGGKNTIIRMDVKDGKLRLRCIDGVLNILPVAENAIEITVDR